MYNEFSFGAYKTYEEAFERFEPSLSSFYRDALPYRIDPFKIYGNLYYVGNKRVCMHLIDTGDGLILFDTGYGNDLYLLINSIWELGFNPHDVKIVIHSHGHFDHMNGGNVFREMFGSKIYMSRVDSDLVEEMPERALAEYGPGKYFDDWCVPDERIEDGQVITLGNTSVRCVLTPGHTLGTMTFFFDAADEEGKKLHVGYLGGAGFLTMYPGYCEKYKLNANKYELMGESIKKVYDEPVDIVIGNHPSQNCTIEKREWWLEHPEKNPFINPEAWRMFLDALNEKRLEYIEKELGK
ncbi:MAG: MBL fold metallo-hydrolase [Eubacteriales bacterium]|nr:MBL fold metallo-hydrolase [Eubacteriales bacterium]